METNLTTYLNLIVDQGAAACIFSVGVQPHLKIGRGMRSIDAPVLDADDLKTLAYSVMSPKQIAQFESTMEMNLSLSRQNIGRFRVNIYQQRGAAAMVITHVPSKAPAIGELGLPPVLEELALLDEGLVLIAGATCSGKNTTLAAMVNCRNARSSSHILCIEDPIEFLHQHRKSIVDQREVGLDTASYEEGLTNAMKEMCDVVVIGQIRDAKTLQQALMIADTGHLCLSTLTAANAQDALSRMLGFFPDHDRTHVLGDLGANLKGIVSQRLVSAHGKARCAAVEVMLHSPVISDLIRAGRINEIHETIARSNELGMMTFDQSLFALYEANKIPLQESLRHADSQTDLKLHIKAVDLAHGGTPGLTTVPDKGGRSPRK